MQTENDILKEFNELRRIHSFQEMYWVEQFILEALHRQRGELASSVEALNWECCGGGFDKDEGYEKCRTQVLSLLSPNTKEQ